MAKKLYSLIAVIAGTRIAEMQQVFAEEPLVLISPGESTFALSGEVCWSAYPPPLDNRKFAIGKLYPDLRTFFLEGLKVNRELQVDELAGLPRNSRSTRFSPRMKLN